MRVISGILKGRNIKGYTLDSTRPTMDRVKESLFGMIQNNIDNAICLDLFAGSGALGIEAISNGAQKCYFVDKEQKVIQVLKENIESFKIEEKSVIVKNDYLKALRKFENDKLKFDVIFLDPPYKMHILNEVLKTMIKNQILKKNGIIICEVEEPYLNTSILNLELIKYKKYGTTYLYIYKLL